MVMLHWKDGIILQRIWIMYHPADRGGVSLTEEERAVRIKATTKEIDRPNTRFHGKMMDSRLKDDGTVEVLYTPVAGATPVPMSFRDAEKLNKYDLEDLRKAVELNMQKITISTDAFTGWIISLYQQFM